MCQGDSTQPASDAFWRPGDDVARVRGTAAPIFRPDVFDAVDAAVDALAHELRALSLDIHEHPEVAFEERHAHDALAGFMEAQGWAVQRHHLLGTAWEARFSHGAGGRTVGVNSEMDALPGIGHACGHNLIAVAGVAIACALRAAMEKLDIAGTVVLLGTPAEERDYGKVTLLEKGAYKDMDVCLMCHPAPGPPLSASLSSSLAITPLVVEYFGHTAHAALAPWEGHNALDAAVAAYTSVALLRQQIKPTHRVHGTLQGRDWAVNIIPDYAWMKWLMRAPTRKEVDVLVPRVRNCLEAAAIATDTKAKFNTRERGVDELRQNTALGGEFARTFASRYGAVDYTYGISSASTDFGNVTYALPSLHPSFAIPTRAGGTNHTPEFAQAAATPAAHAACMSVAKALAALGARVLLDDAFFAEVRRTFDEESGRGGV
ncbi:M20 family metallopeptidase [Phanerochaete sordida]|uniref:Peptidase M20 domain-containing protein 2 n=1 Tax=Phanerochaete sordida TaxID=48140 RepID=A0A9P3G8Q0_9APHY|nr:M20 family metallopeptidase [Phanerochaete sordida]